MRYPGATASRSAPWLPVRNGRRSRPVEGPERRGWWRGRVPNIRGQYLKSRSPLTRTTYTVPASPVNGKERGNENRLNRS